MLVKAIMTKNPVILDPETNIQVAAEKMCECCCGILPVGHVNNIIGVITDRDIVTRVIAKQKSPKRTSVKQVMSKEPLFCTEEDSLEYVFEKLNQYGIRRILVQDKNHILNGILSLGDVMRRVDNKEILGKLFMETILI